MEIKINKAKLIRITTVPISLKTLLKGQHRFMSQNGFEVIGVSSQGSELSDVQQDEGIPVIALEMTRTISPLKDLKALWQFYRLCKKEQPAMVHSHTPKAGIVGMLGARLAGVPIRLHTVAGLPLMETRGAKRTILEAVEKLTYACATRVYPNSRGLYDFILRHQLTTPKKLKVIAGGSSNGIDTTFFAPEQVTAEHRAALREHLGIAKDDFVFIFVGRLVGDKGMASGKPFVASDVPGLREIVKGYGLLFEQGNAKELSDNILSLENNSELKEDIVKSCQRRAEEFDIQKMVDSYIGLYKSVVS